MLDHVSEDGKPVGADERSGWSRVPWALALSGETAVAAAVLAWIEAHALDPDGDLRAGPGRGTGIMRGYMLGHIAIGAWQLERYDLARAIMRRLAAMQHAATGGIDSGVFGPGGEEMQDLLVTAQVGGAALFTGDERMVDGVLRWLTGLWALQPALPDRLYHMREGQPLVCDLPEHLAWLGVTDFRRPRQAYYTPGIAAVFLAGVAMQRGDGDALALSRRFLALNIGGTAEQFTDPDSVQACKFGWGAAAMLSADPEGDWLPHVVNMAEWFMVRQADDGSWGLSRFIAAESGDIDKLGKTAEHVMEVNSLLAALGTAAARGKIRVSAETSGQIA